MPDPTRAAAASLPPLGKAIEDAIRATTTVSHGYSIGPHEAAFIAATTAREWFADWLETKFREAAEWANNPACPDRATYLQVAGAHLGLIGDLDPDRAQRLADPRADRG